MFSITKLYMDHIIIKPLQHWLVSSVRRSSFISKCFYFLFYLLIWHLTCCGSDLYIFLWSQCSWRGTHYLPSLNKSTPGQPSSSRYPIQTTLCASSVSLTLPASQFSVMGVIQSLLSYRDKCCLRKKAQTAVLRFYINCIIEYWHPLIVLQIIFFLFHKDMVLFDSM